MCSLYTVGNPVIANQIIEIDLRGSFYIPFRVSSGLPFMMTAARMAAQSRMIVRLRSWRL